MSPPPTGCAGPLKGALPMDRQSRIHGSRLEKPYDFEVLRGLT
jgi:hypothetical protein